MELRQIRYFVAVAEELHFRRAAELVHVAQPALSQQIRQLEEEIGAALFERTHHKVQLTSAGKAFYARAQTILKDARQAITDARAAERGDAGTITIGFVSSAAISVLPGVLRHIREHMPLADVQLRELAVGDQIECLYRKTIDLGFLHAKLEEKAFETMIVTRERLMVALPNDNVFANCRLVDLKKLEGETVIIPARHSTSGYFERVRAVYQSAGILPERIHHTNLLQTGLLLVGAGLGISLVPESFKRIRVKGVVYRHLTASAPTIDLLAVWRRDNNSQLLARITAELQLNSPCLENWTDPESASG